MDPMIEQFVRANEIRPGWFRQFQRYLVDNVQVRLDEHEAMLPELEALRAEVETLKADKKAKRAGVPA